jgi:hypothetical protein
MNIAIAEPGPVCNSVQLGFHHRPMPDARCPIPANRLLHARITNEQPDEWKVTPMGDPLSLLVEQSPDCAPR